VRFLAGQVKIDIHIVIAVEYTVRLRDAVLDSGLDSGRIMKTDVATQSVLYEEFANAFARATATNKFIFGFLGISAFIFLLFGFLIWVIAFGFFYGLLKLALILDAPYRLLVRICHFENLPPHLVKPPCRSVIYTIVSLIFPAFFVFIGVKGLQNFGFYSQNLIWIFSRAFSIIFSH
jgi:hypothetical protein